VKAGVKSLAIMLGDKLRLCLAILGLLQVILLVAAGVEASPSPFFWTFGIGVWTTSVLWSVLSLDLRDRRSGGRVFIVNIVLVIYFAVVAAGEVWYISQ